MKIGIDFSRGEMEHKTGVEWYSWYITKHLLDLGTEHEIILYSREGGVASPPFGGGGAARRADGVVNLRHLHWPFSFWWTQLRLSVEMLLHPPDVLFVPSHILPLITPRRVVTMVHDVAFKRHPEWYSKKQIRVLEFGVRQIIRKKAVVLVPTEFVKREIVALYPQVYNLQIHVIPHGVDREVFREKSGGGESSSPSPLQGEGRGEVVVPPSRPYFLFVGRLEAKKNISRIVDAFVETHRWCVSVGVPSPKACPESGRGIREGRVRSEEGTPHLVLVGHPGYGYEEFAHKLQNPNIHIIPSVSPEELVILYQNATALVFPTLYEGFGMPILEAMACGCPVITSKGGTHEEVAGDAALLVDPENVQDIASACMTALDEGIRSKYSTKGYTRVQLFSWSDTAQKTVTILQKVV